MKITIEPTEQRRVATVDTMHSTVSVSIACDDLDISETMGQVVKALQAWGFHNESIAKELGDELAWELGLNKKIPPMDKTKFAIGNLQDLKYTSPWKNPMPSSEEVIKNDPALEQDITHEHGGV